MKIMQFPLAKITVVFVLGILISKFYPFSLAIVFSILILSFITLILLFFLCKKNIKYNFIFGILILFSSFFIGISTVCIHDETRLKNHYSHLDLENQTYNNYEVIITEQLKNTLNNDRYNATINKINDNESCGKLIVNIKKDSLTKKIIVGSKCLVFGDLYKNRNPNNPNQFDYGSYLKNQQIYGQIYSDYENVFIANNPKKSIHYYAAKIRDKIILNLEKNHFKKQELSVLVALILGQQQEISPEIIRNYQFAGAVHILSVSGLHVGIILMIITFLLQPISNSKKGIFIKLFISLFALWSFGILAGLAPSIVRAVTMFSFVAIALYLKRSVNIYHTLLVSIFLILLIKPSFLFDVGFQLSYLALFFIVWLQPILKLIWSPKNKIVIYFWDILTVSFAAQIGTLPLSLYYFHQFPGLFFITNIIILPMLGIIMAVGIFVIILAFCNYVPQIPMKILEFGITILNKIIAWVASFESFIFKDISLNFPLFLCSYLLIIILFIYVSKPNFNKLAFLLSSVILFSIIQIYTKYKNQKIDEFIVFNRKGYSLLTDRKNTFVNVYSNDSIIKNLEDNLVLKSYLIANYCKSNSAKKTQNVYYFKNKKIALIDNSGVYLEKSNPDILVLSNSPKINLEHYLQENKPKEIIADASNQSSLRKKWKETCSKEKILFHDTTEKGFYILH